MRTLFAFLFTLAFCGRFAMPVGAASITVFNGPQMSTFYVVSPEGVSCELTAFSSAHQQEGPHSFNRSFSLTVSTWTEGWATLTCDGETVQSDTLINLTGGYRVDVIQDIGGEVEEPTPEPEGVESIEVTQTGIPVDDYYTFIVNVIGANYVPTCEIVTDMYPIGITEYEPLRSFPAYIDHGQQGVKGNVTLTCDGVSSTIEFKGNYDTDGVVLLNRTGVNGGSNTGSGRAGNGYGKPIPDTYSPFVDFQELRCLFGAVNIFWHDAQNPEDSGITIRGPIDVGGSPEIDYIGGAPISAITATSGGPVPYASKVEPNAEAAFKGQPIVIRQVGQTIEIEIRDTRDFSGKADVCQLNLDGSLIGTTWR